MEVTFYGKGINLVVRAFRIDNFSNAHYFDILFVNAPYFMNEKRVKDDNGKVIEWEYSFPPQEEVKIIARERIFRNNKKESDELVLLRFYRKWDNGYKWKVEKKRVSLDESKNVKDFIDFITGGNHERI